MLYTIITKPIALTRLQLHIEEEIEEWFEGYRATLAKFKIKSRKYIYNIDETGARIACPKGE